MADLAVFMRLFLKRRGWLALGGLLMLTTLIASFGLLSLSGWFITATALAGLGAGGLSVIGFDIFRPGAGIRFFALVRTGSRYGERLATHEATFRVLADLRLWLFRKCIPLDARQMAAMRSGDMLNRLTSDIDALDSLYLRVMAPTAVAVAMGLVALVFLGQFDLMMAAASVGLLALSGAAVPVLANRLGDAAGRDMVAFAADLRIRVVDGVQGLTELKLFGAEMHHRRTVDDTTQKLVMAQKKMARVTGFSSALSQIFANLAVWSVLFIGLARHADGALAAPILVMMVLATMALFEASAPLPLAYQYLGKTRAAASRILEIARQEPTIRDPETPDVLPAGNSLTFDAVTFGYDPTRPVLRSVSVSIGDGEKVGVVGPSGAGKSTLINLALRLEDPQAGAVRIGGVDLASLRRADIWKRVAYLSQRGQIFAGTIRDNLHLGNPTAGDAMLFSALAAANLDAFVDGLPEGLDTWVGENGVLISGGQARRLALARVVLKDSPILLLDEPTEGLDDDTRADLFERLISESDGRTVLMITHHVTGLEKMDRVLRLEGGSRVTDVTRSFR